MFRNTILSALVIAGAGFASVAYGQATLTDNTPIAVGASPSLISVTSGSEGFESAAGTGAIDTSFNAPVLDYAFFSAASPYASGTSGTLGASRISNLTNPGSGDDKTSLWETSPTTGAADFTGKGVKSKAETGTGNGTTFTVDISGLGNGSVYVINGSWQARTDWLTVSMTGAGQTPVTTDSGDGDGDGNSSTFGFSPAASGVAYYAKRIDFADAAAYETITFTVYESGSSDGYFSGVVLTWAISGDVTPPAPSQMSWASAPAAVSDSEISMAAVTASDDNGVEYQFTRYTNSVLDVASVWQNSTNYTDTGLATSTTYGYTVQARDKSASQNSNTVSSVATATTLVGIPPTPSQMTWASAPAAVSESEISMTAVTASDDDGVEYQFTETSGNTGGSSSDWQISINYTDTGLTPSTIYSYTVQARDMSANHNSNTVSAAAAATTLAADTIAPPTPTFVTPLGPISANTISLAANAVTDPEGEDVEYRFNNLTDATDSGWLTSPSYIETGLTPLTSYSFTVEARDTALNLNVSAPSATESVSTLAVDLLTVGTPTLLGNRANPAYDVSVNNDNAFIRAHATLGGTTIDLTGTIKDYAFIQSGQNGAADIIGAITSDGSDDRGTINLWTTGDPSTVAADFVTAQRNVSTGVSGSIDISTFDTGTIWFVTGAYAHQPKLTGLMSDTSGTLPSIALSTYTLNSNIDGEREEQYAVPLSFDDASGYDQITFSWVVDSRFGGIIMSVESKRGTLIFIK